MRPDETFLSIGGCCNDRRLRLRENGSSVELNTRTATSQVTYYASQMKESKTKRKMVVAAAGVVAGTDGSCGVEDTGGVTTDVATEDASVESDASLVQPAWLPLQVG